MHTDVSLPFSGLEQRISETFNFFAECCHVELKSCFPRYFLPYVSFRLLHYLYVESPFELFLALATFVCKQAWQMHANTTERQQWTDPPGSFVFSRLMHL